LVTVIKDRIKDMVKKRRHPTGRAKPAVVAGVDLFFPRNASWRKIGRVRKFLRRIRTKGPEIEQLATEGSEAWTGRKGLLRRKTIFVDERKLEENSTVLHEFLHFYRIGKSHTVTSNAIDGYFAFQQASGPKPIQHGKDSHKIMQNTNWAVKQGRRLDKDEFEHDFLGLRGWSTARFGHDFGVFAASREHEWKKPASGLFLIREVCNGLPVDSAIRKIESGKLDAEISAFAKKHLAILLRENKK